MQWSLWKVWIRRNGIGRRDGGHFGVEVGRHVFCGDLGREYAWRWRMNGVKDDWASCLDGVVCGRRCV